MVTFKGIQEALHKIAEHYRN